MTQGMFSELLWVLPFFTLLLAIAILPLLHNRWWNKNYIFVSFGLGAVVVWHYLFQLKQTTALSFTGLEYLSFIALIGSLFVVSGGIYIHTKGEVTPLFNCLFLFFASAVANLLGTTGASMVFLRPWIRMNKYRLTAFHIVFFIFLVSNIGGALTPIGDPPLFLGYLEGVPFFWVLKHVWLIWLTAIGVLLLVFYAMDSINFKRAPLEIREKETQVPHRRTLRGKRNLFFLAMILGAVFINHPPFLREAVMLLAAYLSFRLTPRDIHEANDFTFAPIREVAVLFLGIFATMIPALEWLERYGGELGIRTQGQFYWWTGALSSVLDNAPTYLNFFRLSLGVFTEPVSQSFSHHHAVMALLGAHGSYVLAISVGAVFFGAMTYIGNGPNFLVKSIAEQSKIKMPSFFGYIFKYSIPILLPVFTLIWFLFFRQ